MKNEPKVPPPVHDEAYVEEKAKELITMVANLYPYESNPCVIPKSKAKDFIRTTIKDCQPKVSKVFVTNWILKLEEKMIVYDEGKMITHESLIEMLKEAGVEVSDD